MENFVNEFIHLALVPKKAEIIIMKFDTYPTKYFLLLKSHFLEFFREFSSKHENTLYFFPAANQLRMKFYLKRF